MDQKYNVKAKVNGKYHTFGNVLPGQYGPRLGLKVTPELRQLIAGASEGGWVNLSLFPDDREPRPAAENSAPF